MQTWPQTPKLLYADKFLEMTKRYGSRVIWQEVDPCPNGERDCEVCSQKGYYSGFHHREVKAEAFTVALLYSPAPESGLREVLPHVYRASRVTIEGTKNGQATTFIEGEDFVVRGRAMEWLKPPDYQTPYYASYEAFPEYDVHLIHVAGDFAGVSRKAETNTFHRLGALQQGQLGMDIPMGELQSLKIGDRITPVDARMIFTETLQVGGYNPSRHRFVTGIRRAFAIPYGETEEEVQVTYDAVRGVFDIHGASGMPQDTLVTVVYEACPTYVVWHDMGEFRTVLGQQQPRLVVLSRLEMAQGQR